MALTLKYDFATSPTLVADTGPTLTIARASTATVTDYDNVLRTVQSAEARFTGGRRVENLCLGLENAGWVINESATKTTGQSDPVGGTDAVKVVTTSNFNSGIYIQRDGTGGKGQGGTGATQTYSCWLKGDAGGETVLFGDATYRAANPKTLTTEWQRFWTSTGDDSEYFMLYADSAAQTFYAYGAQIENVEGQDDPSPSTYIPTTTAAVSKWYATKRRTNLFLQTSDLDNASWVFLRSTGTTDNAVAPDGTTSAMLWTDNGDTNTHMWYQDASARVGTGQYTTSVYAKAGTKSAILLYDAGATQGRFFDLSDGTEGGTLVGTPDASGIEPASNTISGAPAGWYRCWITTTAPTILYYYICDSTSSPGHNYAGDSTGTLFVWGPQVEKGATATAYIATTTTVASSDFDTAITATGLLVEEARTNLALKSQEFDDAEWTVVNSAITANQTTAPDGTTTADLYEGNGGGSGTTQLISNAKTTSTATAYCISLFAKADNLSWLTLIWDNGGVANTRTYFDVGNGVVGTEGAGADSSGITDFGNGWYRCWISFTSDAVDTTGNLRIELADGDGDVTVTLDGTSSIFVWGAQLEAGAFPTSYIPTTTVSVTRAADVVSTTDVSWYNQPAGTLYIAASQPYEDTGIPDVFVEIHDNSSSDRWLIYGGTVSQQLRSFIGSSAGNNAEVNATLIRSDNTLFRAVTAATNNDYELYIDGSRIGTGDQTLDMPTNFINLNVGSRYDETEQPNGHIAEIRYYNSRLSNATLENMSNGIFQFSGSVAGDGGHIWPPRANDPRWTQLITDSGITTTGNFIDDVHAALETMSSTTGQLDDLWEKTKTANSVTDTSEPYLY